LHPNGPNLREKSEQANWCCAVLLPQTWEFDLEQSPGFIKFFTFLLFSFLRLFEDAFCRSAGEFASLYCCEVCVFVCGRVGGCSQTSEANSVDPRSKKKGLNQISQRSQRRHTGAGCMLDV